MENVKFCQSCCMPLEREEDFGTNADCSKNEDYCIYCYKSGEFTDPKITMEEMMDLVVEILTENNEISKEEAEEIASHIPTLKRWKK